MEERELQRYLKKIRQASSSEPGKMKSLAKELRRRGKAENDEKAVAYADYYIAEACFRVGPRQDILKYSIKALTYAKKVDNYKMAYNSYNLIGIAYTIMEEHQMALDAFMSALSISKEHPRCANNRALYNNIGVLYAILGGYSEAMRYFDKLYKICSKQKRADAESKFNALYNYADCCAKIGQYDKSLRYVEEIHENNLSNATYLQDLLLDVLLIRVYYGKGEIDRANAVFDSMIENLDQDASFPEVHGDLEAIAVLLEEHGFLDRAWKLIEFMEKGAEETQITIEWIRVCRMKIEYFRAVQDQEQEFYWLKQYKHYREIRSGEMRKNQLVLINNQIKMNKIMENYKKESEHMEEMRLLSERDSLTGLLNRYSLNQLLVRYFKAAHQREKTLGGIFIDIDCFKQYNDTYGHVQGDECLKQLAEILLSFEEEDVHFARYGGDEFFGITLGKTEDEVKALVDNILEKVRGLNLPSRNSYVADTLTVTLGAVNIMVKEQDTVIDFVNYADHALYRAKENGRNQGVFEKI